ncbi:MAG: sensor histidine kinase, partial [Alsobacter sp.]
RAEAGSSRDGMADFDLSEVVRDMVELYEPVAEEAGVPLRLDVPATLPVHGSRELIGQALANLVDNAIKHAPRAGADDGPVANAPELLVKAAVHGDRVEIVVADRGPGIPEADRGRVLDRFVRLEGARSRPGFGLGLSLAAAVARLHGGTLRLEDNAPGLRAILALPARPGGLHDGGG